MSRWLHWGSCLNPTTCWFSSLWNLLTLATKVCPEIVAMYFARTDKDAGLDCKNMWCFCVKVAFWSCDYHGCYTIRRLIKQTIYQNGKLNLQWITRQWPTACSCTGTCWMRRKPLTRSASSWRSLFALARKTIWLPLHGRFNAMRWGLQQPGNCRLIQTLGPFSELRGWGWISC